MYIASETRYDSMPYNRTGKSGLKLPAVSLGLWHNFGDTGCYETMRNMCRTAFRAEFRPDSERRPGRLPGRDRRQHQSGLLHVAGSLRRMGQPEVYACQP